MPDQDKKKTYKEAREIFEPRYGRKLSDKEVEEIIRNLTEFGRALIDIAKGKNEEDFS